VLGVIIEVIVGVHDCQELGVTVRLSLGLELTEGDQLSLPEEDCEIL
jgi:hypothetical protein